MSIGHPTMINNILIKYINDYQHMIVVFLLDCKTRLAD